MIERCEWCWKPENTCGCWEEWARLEDVALAQPLRIEKTTVWIQLRLKERIERVKEIPLEEQKRLICDGNQYRPMFLSPHVHPDALLLGLRYWLQRHPANSSTRRADREGHAAEFLAYVKNNPVFGLLLLENPEIAVLFTRS